MLTATFLICSTLATFVDSSKSVKHVHVIYRHGDRTPIHHFRSVPGLTAADWPQGAGQLTLLGMQQHFRLGRYLRDRYDHLVSESYDREEIHVRSSNFDRTLMSAQANLAGLYWNLTPHAIPEFPWQPIPIHTVDKESDALLLGNQCPRLKQLKSKIDQDLDNQTPVADVEFIKKLSSHIGNISAHNMWTIQDSIFCAKSHNFTLPNWLTDDVWSHISRFSNRSWREHFKEAGALRLGAGVLMGTIVDHLVDISSYRRVKNHFLTGRKMVIYSTHDTDVAALMAHLGVYNNIQPPYCATVFLELSQSKTDWFVDLFYRNDSSKDPFQITLPFCQSPCTLTKFLSNVRNRTLSIDKFKSECSADLRSIYISKFSVTRGFIWALVGILCLALIIVFLGILTYIFRKRDFVRYTPLQNMQS